jgi:hypothetical protein
LPANEISPPAPWITGRERLEGCGQQIDKQVLFAKHDGDSYLGLVILLPDWQRSGQLWQLTRELGRLGFDTLLLPSPSRPSSTPPPRRSSRSSTIFASSLPPASASWGCQAAGGGFKLLLAQVPAPPGPPTSSPANSCPPPMPWCCSTASSPTS